MNLEDNRIYSINKDELDNIDYIFNHKLNIIKAFNLLLKVVNKVNLRDLEIDFEELKGRILTHDMDKLKPEIFFPYTKKFFTKKEDNETAYYTSNSVVPDHLLSSLNIGNSEKFNNEFNNAANNHYSHNRHHPEYFVINGGIMDDTDIAEYCIDLTAMSMTNDNTAYDYFMSKIQSLKKEFGDIMNVERVAEVLKVMSETTK